LTEEGDRLAGGNIGGAWRGGETVRRIPGPWTPAVHALLAHLGPRLAHVPTVLGFDERGREVLSYLPGRVVDVDSEMLTEAQLCSVVGWTRSFHEAAENFTHEGPWRGAVTEAVDGVAKLSVAVPVGRDCVGHDEPDDVGLYCGPEELGPSQGTLPCH
jgi:hypothetical protein